MSSTRGRLTTAHKYTLIVLLLLCASCSRSPRDYEQEIGSNDDAASEHSLNYKLPELSDQLQPFNIAIIGDNTAKLDGGWTNILANWISSRYDRTVVINAIEDPAIDRYSALKTLDKGSPVPINIWVAAVPNLTVQQTAERLPILLPFTDEVSPDLVIFSQGHNAGSRSLARTAIPLLEKIRTQYADAEILTVLQNPWRSDVQAAELHDLNIRDLKTSAKIAGFQTIDVHDAFVQDPRPLEDLLDTNGIYPNGQGYILWAQIIESILQ